MSSLLREMKSNWDGRERRRGPSPEQLRDRHRATRLTWEALYASPCQDNDPVGIREARESHDSQRQDDATDREQELADPSRKQEAAEAEERRQREQRVREIREEHQNSNAKTIK